MKISYASEYPKTKTEHSKALRSVQVLPLTGDGRLAGLYNRASCSPTQNQITRERLVEARYQEWLESRAGFQLTQEG